MQVCVAVSFLVLLPLPHPSTPLRAGTNPESFRDQEGTMYSLPLIAGQAVPSV